MTNIAIIPARGGSKGIFRKNIKMLAGKPLLVWTIESALLAKNIDKVIVSTEDDDIKRISINAGAEVIYRSEKLAKDNVHAINIVKDYVKNLSKNCNINKVCMLLPTSPLRTAGDIDNAFGMFNYYNTSSVVSVCATGKTESSFRYISKNNILEPIKKTNHYEAQRQDIVRPVYSVNGAIFIATVNHIKHYGSFHKGQPTSYIMSKLHSVDINDEEDFSMAEAILRRGR